MGENEGVVSTAENQRRLPGGGAKKSVPKDLQGLIRYKLMLARLSWKSKQHKQRNKGQQQHRRRWMNNIGGFVL